MKYFNSPISIKLDDETISLAKEFSLAVVETVNYSDCNQNFKSKIAEDHFISKLGESAVARVFTSLGHSVTGPDFTIYMGNYKSWDSDLKIDNIEIAVKTQKSSQAKKYGLSWMFQSTGRRRDPVLDQPEAWVVFVECDDNNNFECRVFQPMQMKELELKEPRLPHLQGKKKVYYYDV